MNNPRPLQYLFWDFDGTLYNSYPQMRQAMLRTLSAFHVSADPAEVDRLLKTSVYQACRHYALLHEIALDAFLACFHHHHEQETNFPPYAGLGDCLRRLHEAGFHHYLYTHRGPQALAQLEQDGLICYFSDAVTRADHFPDKPAPDALLALMSRNGLTPDACAMIGDRDIDVLSGKNAGMRGILFDPDHFFPNLQADLRASSMEELCTLLLRSPLPTSNSQCQNDVYRLKCKTNVQR
ncbi:MAG: HAD-IA family hydrolase [Clostridia bacterium]